MRLVRNKFKLLFLVCLTSFVVSGQSDVVVTVFNQPNLNGAAGGCDNENENLIEIINALPGYTVDGSAIVNFTNTTALQTALNDAQFFFMTDMESGNPNSTSFLPTAAQTILRDFVDDGGVMVMTGTYGSNDNDFLNNVFGWDLTQQTGSSWAKQTSNTAGTPFDDVTVSSLPNPSATDAINSGTVANFTPMYGTSSNATVAVIEYGSGYVIFLGYDFFNTGLNPTVSSPCAAYNNDWVQQVLPAALAYATELSSSSLENLTETSGDFVYNFSENATTYYVVVEASEPAPTASQIKAGVDYGTTTLVDNGSASTTANTDYTFAVSGLSACTDYKIYAVSEWNDGGTMTFSSLETGSFTTADQTSPTLVLQDLTRTLTSTSGLSVAASDFITSFSDACSGTYTITSSDFNFTCSDIGTQTVSVTIEDESGNSTTETADITITNGLTSTLSISNSLCTNTPMYWASWSSVTSTSGTGTFAGLGVTVDVTHSQGGLSTTPSMYNHSTFPSSYNVPNTTSLRNDSAGTFTFCFSQPIENPQIAFSSIGNSSTPVPITTSVPYNTVWNGQSVTYTSSTAFTGNEGFTIISFPGTHECITLTYSADESYANLAFGFENFNCDDPTVCAGDPITLTASGGSGYSWSPSASLSASNTASVIATPSATTTYSVIDPSDACSAPQTITITVPVPTAPTASSPQSSCPGSTVADLEATAPTGMGVLWYTGELVPEIRTAI